ncbi:hypothetical protein [Flavobacterium sp. JP2137]|uniref:hypothetical protein n=1 Tax=Flavobacterium sp. JP2137 TaxID=3414510 RepID=UPI003D300FB2
MDSNITVKEISTLEEVTSYLNGLQEGASYSLETTIKAQLEVISFIQSPTLVDTTFDSLILFLKRSLEGAESLKEQNNLRDHFSRMIQNYIFFFNARLQLEINSNKEEAIKLFHQAGEMLSKTITDIVLMAAPGGQLKGAKVAGVVVKNFFSKDNNASEGFLVSLINWWRKDKIIAEKRNEFYKTLNSMFFKLGKHNDLIGTSFLINGVIINYVSELSDYFFINDLNEVKARIKEYENKIEKQPILFSEGGITATTFGIGIVTIVIRWIWSLITAVSTAVVDAFSDEKSTSTNESWFLSHFFLVIIITALVELLFVMKSLSKRKEYENAIEQEKDKYQKILSEKKQYAEQLNDIARKFEE